MQHDMLRGHGDVIYQAIEHLPDNPETWTVQIRSLDGQLRQRVGTWRGDDKEIRRRIDLIISWDLAVHSGL